MWTAIALNITTNTFESKTLFQPIKFDIQNLPFNPLDAKPGEYRELKLWAKFPPLAFLDLCKKHYWSPPKFQCKCSFFYCPPRIRVIWILMQIEFRRPSFFFSNLGDRGLKLRKDGIMLKAFVGNQLVTYFFTY